MVCKINMIGLKFNNLTVISEYDTDKHNKIRYSCLCDCGKIVIVHGTNLRRNRVKSCGCLHQKQLIEGLKNKQHGLWGTKIYNTWRAMIRRCTDKNFISYKDYGAKGIKFDPNWEKFENFFSDMGSSYVDGYTIERLNNLEGYFKGNCTWIPRKDQPRNATSNKLSMKLAIEVRDLYNYGYNIFELTQIYNCSKSVINNCVNNISWK